MGKTSTGAVHVEKAMEGKLGDQSFLNHKFLKTYRALPKAYNMETRMWNTQCSQAGKDQMLAGSRVIHFVGDTKPWTADHAAGYDKLHLTYRDLCWKPA